MPIISGGSLSSLTTRAATAPETGNGLYLGTLLNELRLFGHHEDLDRRINWTVRWCSTRQRSASFENSATNRDCKPLRLLRRPGQDSREASQFTRSETTTLPVQQIFQEANFHSGPGSGRRQALLPTVTKLQKAPGFAPLNLIRDKCIVVMPRLQAGAKTDSGSVPRPIMAARTRS